MVCQEIDRLRWMTLGLAAVYYVSAVLVACLSGMRIDFLSFFDFIGFGLVFTAIFSVYCPLRGMRLFGHAGETALLIVLVLPPVVIATYLSMRVGMPVADGLLSRLDESLGFDWRGFIIFVDTRPVLAAFLGFAYQTFQVQLVLLPLVLCLFGNAARAYRFCLGYMLICAISSAVSIWFPAFGTYATYGTRGEDLENINAFFGFFFLDQFNAVRNDPHFVLSLDRAAGILTFPSVHAAVACLCLWGGWGLPILRYPMALLNVLMAVSAITHGSHYLVDVIAGLAVAVVSIRLVTRMGRTPVAVPPSFSHGLAPSRAIPRS